jgi:hypothetical protein
MNVDINAVEEFYNTYHAKVQARPDLFVNDPYVLTVTLPDYLLDFANASAGHSGFGSGARAVGIRKSTTDSRKARNDAFSSVEALAKFIQSSECNAAEYILRVKERHIKKAGVQTDDRLVANHKDVVVAKHGKQIFIQLSKVFGRDMIKNSIDVLTVNEFELRFGL